MEYVILVLENNKHLEFKNFLYVSELKKNLILVSSINKSNYSIYFNKNAFIRKNDSFIYSSTLVDNLFYITLLYYLLLKIIISHLREKYPTLIKLFYDIYA